MAHWNRVLNMIGHYKYIIVMVIGVLVVGFLDDNSFMKRVQMDMQIADLNEEIKKYGAQNEADKKQLKELKVDSKAIEKIARERYFMKAADEDIYVLSDDEKPEKADNETVE